MYFQCKAYRWRRYRLTANLKGDVRFEFDSIVPVKAGERLSRRMLDSLLRSGTPAQALTGEIVEAREVTAKRPCPIPGDGIRQ